MRSRIIYGLKQMAKYIPPDKRDYMEMRLAVQSAMAIDGVRQPRGDVIGHPLKSGYAVQVVNRTRYLRYLFLFPNNLIITSMTKKGSQGVFFESIDVIRLGKYMTNVVKSANPFSYLNGILEVHIHQVRDLDTDIAFPSLLQKAEMDNRIASSKNCGRADIAPDLKDKFPNKRKSSDIWQKFLPSSKQVPMQPLNSSKTGNTPYMTFRNYYCGTSRHCRYHYYSVQIHSSSYTVRTTTY
ncbi:Hypothetical predicted protein [Octopus vulgaris]|uniref:Uncharacterized protein n=1 Tax=Octopus vulgaris TaxID=6645 RepID=A0AA36B020_OCTVU|nr:Hypothetical predicted protein [Octopus vulgaris]